MSKQITILQENLPPLVFDDNDKRDLEEYTKELSSLLSSNNVVVLHTSSCSIITRPHKIISVIVKNLNKKLKTSKEQVDEIKEEIVDIIKDDVVNSVSEKEGDIFEEEVKD